MTALRLLATSVVLAVMAGTACTGTHDGGSTPLDLRPFFAAIDSDRDGCLTLAEWRRAGAPQSSYDGLHDQQGCVTLARMSSTPAPPGIDLNNDGRLTLEEMKTFDRKMAPLMKDGAPPKQ